MSKLLVDKREVAFDTGLSPDDEIRLRNDLGKFVVNFIKAFLQTSFYRTKHKMTHEAIEAFFTSVDPMRDFFEEITLQATSDETKPDFTLEGVFIEPVQLSTCIKSVLRDEFLSKLRDFFVWNKLVTLSLREELKQEEFVRFLEIATRKLEYVREKASKGQEQEKKERSEKDKAMLMARLSDLLLENDILNVSCICRDELVFVDRQLPWRVKLALSRLMKNLKDLPLFARASKQEIQQAKTLLLREIIRPLRGGDMLVDFLLNCDLVAKAGVDMEGMDIEAEILAILKRDQLRRVSTGFLNVLEKLEAAKQRDDEQIQKGVVLLRKCALPLSDVLDEESMGIFRRAVKGGYIDRKELPKNVQAHLAIEKQADAFLEDPKPVLMQFATIKDAAAFRDKASAAVLLCGELMYRHEFDWSLKICKLLFRLTTPQAGGSERVRELAEDSLDSIGTEANFQRMVEALPKLKDAQLKPVFGITELFKRRSVPYLINELLEDIKPELRDSICTVMEQMTGPDVAQFVRGALNKAQQRWQYYRDLLRIMGNLNDPKGFQKANNFCADDEPEVRAAAYTAISRLDGKRAERELLRGLMDPDQRVRRTAVVFLGEVGSRQPDFLDFLVRLFSGQLDPGVGALLGALFKRSLTTLVLSHLRLLASGASALSKLAEQEQFPAAKLEPPVIRTLSQQVNTRIFRGGDKAIAERGNLIHTLLSILKLAGTAVSLAPLRNVRDASDKRVRFLAAGAIREIKVRENIEAEETWKEKMVRWIRGLLGS